MKEIFEQVWNTPKEDVMAFLGQGLLYAGKRVLEEADESYKDSISHQND